jgi:hypothetical protein
MEALHREDLALEGVVGLIQQGARHRHPGGFKHRIPTGFLVLKPAPPPLTIGGPSRGSDVIRQVA